MSILSTIYGCGSGSNEPSIAPVSGGQTTPAPAPIPNPAPTPAPSPSPAPVPSPAPIAVAPELSTSDRINGAAITNPALVALLTQSLGAQAPAAKASDSSQFPIAGGQSFGAQVSYAATDTRLTSYGIAVPQGANSVFVIGRFQSFTAARIFQCAMKPEDFSATACELSNPPFFGNYANQTGFRCRDIGLKGAALIEQCIGG